VAAQLKGDATAYGNLLADDYTAVRRGKLATKTQEVEDIRSGVLKYEKSEILDIKIQAYGNVAVATSGNSFVGSSHGKLVSSETLVTRVWIKQNGSWKAVAMHGSQVPTTPDRKQAKDQLVGTYRLISTTRTILATGEKTDTFGKAPRGYIIYTRDGRMMALLVKDERPKPKEVATMTDQERVELFKTMVAYTGTYDFDGKKVTHHIDVSWNQTWTGIDNVRNVAFDGQKLILTTGQYPYSTDGKLSIAELIWEKVD
jgi:ketosteroid isomerase-like protein